MEHLHDPVGCVRSLEYGAIRGGRQTVRRGDMRHVSQRDLVPAAVDRGKRKLRRNQISDSLIIIFLLTGGVQRDDHQDGGLLQRERE